MASTLENTDSKWNLPTVNQDKYNYKVFFNHFREGNIWTLCDVDLSDPYFVSKFLYLSFIYQYKLAI